MFLTGIHRARDQEEHQEGVRGNFGGIYNVQRSGQVWRNSKRRVQDRRECEKWVGGLWPDPVRQRLGR